MMRSLFSLLSPAGPRSRLSVLIFHRVLAQPDPLLPSAEPMLEKMSSPSVEVRRAGFTVAAVGPV